MNSKYRLLCDITFIRGIYTVDCWLQEKGRVSLIMLSVEKGKLKRPTIKRAKRKALKTLQEISTMTEFVDSDYSDYGN